MKEGNVIKMHGIKMDLNSLVSMQVNVIPFLYFLIIEINLFIANLT